MQSSEKIVETRSQVTSQENPFSEKEFLLVFNNLIQIGNLEGALDYLILSMERMAGSQLQRKEKLKHFAYCGRQLEQAGLGKYGIYILKALDKYFERIFSSHELKSRNLFVDFGCGAHQPLTLSAYMYAKGFEKCVAVDTQPMRSSSYAALSMYDAISYMLMFPSEFVGIQQNEEAFIDRLKKFNLKDFYKGNFQGGISPMDAQMNFEIDDIRNADIEYNSVSFLSSFGVLEHVLEVESVFQHIYDLSEPGGLQYHTVDLADHRIYRFDGKFNAFSFLTESTFKANQNRLRMPEYIAIFENVGFEVLDYECTRQTMPEETFHNLQPRWKNMPKEDLEVVSLFILLRKPG